MSSDGSGGGDDVDALLNQIRHAAEIDRENNRLVLENHIGASELVIANVAALRSTAADPLIKLVEALAVAGENPT